MSVSVIIPNLNRAEFLEEAIQSVLRQTLPAAEIIVVDMQSSDNSDLIAKKFEKKVRFISKPFKNQSESRNFGIRIARGSLISFLDSDDLWLEKKLEEQSKFMAVHKQYAFSYTDAVVVDLSGEEMPHSYVYNYQKTNPYQGKIARLLLTGHNVIPTSSVMARKSALREVRGFDERLSYHEDRDLWIRLSQNGGAGFLDKILAVYRVHGKQFTKDRELLREEQWKLVLEKHRDLIGSSEK